MLIARIKLVQTYTCISRTCYEVHAILYWVFGINNVKIIIVKRLILNNGLNIVDISILVTQQFPSVF